MTALEYAVRAYDYAPNEREAMRVLDLIARMIACGHGYR